MNSSTADPLLPTAPETNGVKSTTANGRHHRGKKGKEPPAVQEDGPTLLDKLGGPDNMLALMDQFYARVLDDPHLSRFFINIDVVKLKRHSLNIIATAFSPGNANNATTDEKPLIKDIPAYLAKTHKKLFEKEGVTEAHFDLFVGHFCDTMQSVDIESETMMEAEDKLRRFRPVFEEGAEKAAARQKKKRESKVRFSAPEGTTTLSQKFIGLVDNVDPKWAAGACVVVGVFAASCIMVKRRRV